MILEAFAELVSKNQNEANLFFEKYQKQRLKFFQNRVIELNQLYSFSKDEEHVLWGELLSAEQPQTNGNNDTVKVIHSLTKLNIEHELNENSDINIAFIGWLKNYWSKAWRKYADVNKCMLSARFTINKEKIRGDKTANLPNAEDELIKELKKAFTNAESLVQLRPNEILSFNRIKELDSQVLKYFKQHNIGSATRSIISNLTKINNDEAYNLKSRSAAWDNPLYFWQMIAACRWLDYTKRFVLEIQEKPAALTTPIFRQMSNSMKRGNILNSDGTGIVNAKGKNIVKIDTTACLPLTTAKSVLRSEIPLLSSVTAFYVVTWLLIQVHKQFIMNHKEPRKIIFQGDAFRRLGEVSGAGTSDATVAKIRKIIPTLAGCVFHYRTNDRIGEGNLLSYRYEKAIGQNFSVLEIEMQAIACPGFVQTLPSGGIEFQEQRQMLPILGIFPFYGRKNDHSSQASFQAELLLEMRPRAREIYERGGIYLNNDTLSELAAKASMPEKLIKPVIELWVKENYLERTEDNLYNLGTRELGARQMLIQAGKLELDGSVAGKTSLKKKRKKLSQKK